MERKQELEPEDVQLDVEAKWPEKRLRDGLEDEGEKAYDQGWNDCLDELALLRRVSAPEVVFEFSPSPCGHSSQYAYTEDGGKNIVCLLCERRVSGKGAQPERTFCKHCGNRIYFDAGGPLREVWRHTGSNFDQCFGGLETLAEPSPAPVPATPEGVRPKIICLCGSTRFIEQFAIQTWELELQGHIVLGCTLLPSWYCPVRDHLAESLGVKDQRDNHHLQKIDLADEVLVLNIGGYIGESTKREIEYATKTGKPINYLEPNVATTQGTPEGAK